MPGPNDYVVATRHEWGTVIALEGHHGLCPACQRTAKDMAAVESAV
ncbi:hypothetical protein ACFYO2_48370 [Streptomyces sp. NPDC006602]